MTYLDTNVIIAFLMNQAKNFDANELLSSYSDDEIVGKLTLIKLASVHSRAGLPDSLPLTLYSIKHVKSLEQRGSLAVTITNN